MAVIKLFFVQWLNITPRNAHTHDAFIISLWILSLKNYIHLFYFCFVIFQYLNISNAIGPYSYASEENKVIPPVLCIYQYKEGIIYGFNESFTFNSEIDKSKFICFYLFIFSPTNDMLIKIYQVFSFLILKVIFNYAYNY